MPFPDSTYPSVIRGYTPTQSLGMMNAAPEMLRVLRRVREVFEQLSDGDWRHLDATYVDQLIESDGLHACDQVIALAEGRD